MFRTARQSVSTLCLWANVEPPVIDAFAFMCATHSRIQSHTKVQVPADVIDVIPKALGQTNRPGSSSVPHSPSVRFDIVPMGKRRAPVVDASAFATGQRCSENGGTCYGECGLVWHECH